MKIRLLQILIGSLLLSCSLTPLPPRISVNVSVDEKRFREIITDSERGGSAFKPTSASTFQCYFVSIGGTGIASKFTRAQLSGLDPACSDLELGETSVLKTSAELLAGVGVSVPAGKTRTIRVFGVNSNTGTTCSGKTLPEVFGTTKWGSIFEVGKVTRDLLVGDDVSITSNYIATNFDLAANCSKRAVMPLAAGYFLGLQGSITSIHNLPPMYSTTPYSALGKGADLIFPISKVTIATMQGMHFLFVAPQGNKPTSRYTQVAFISNGARSVSTVKSRAASCALPSQNDMLSSSNITSVHYGSVTDKISKSFSDATFSFVADNGSSPYTLNTLLINNLSGDTTTGLEIGPGDYVHLTLYSPLNVDNTKCPGLILGDIMALAVEP